MPPRDEHVAEWLEKAEEDLSAARRLMEPTPSPIPTPAAFHCQQSAEKTLKAFLVSREVPFKKVHNLTYLMDLCEEEGNLDLGSLREDVSRLAPFAVDERYPGARQEPPPDVVEELLGIAEDLFAVVSERI